MLGSATCMGECYKHVGECYMNGGECYMHGGECYMHGGECYMHGGVLHTCIVVHPHHYTNTHTDKRTTIRQT